MGKWTDKLYITQGEWATSFGGAAATRNASSQMSKLSFLPFGCCNCSYVQLLGRNASPDVQPVIELSSGLLYDRNVLDSNIIRKEDFIDIYWEEDPVTGEPMCPVSRKVFTEHIPIVAIRTSGWLYAKETIDELNLSKKNFFDLMTGDSFTRADLIQLCSGTVSKHSKSLNISSKTSNSTNQSNIMSSSIETSSGSTIRNASVSRVLDALENRPTTLKSECHRLGLEKMQLRFLSSKTISCPSAAPMPPKSVFNPPQSTKGTKGATAASLTSTSMSIVTKNELLESTSNQPVQNNLPGRSFQNSSTVTLNPKRTNPNSDSNVNSLSMQYKKIRR